MLANEEEEYNISGVQPDKNFEADIEIVEGDELQRFKSNCNILYSEGNMTLLYVAKKKAVYPVQSNRMGITYRTKKYDTGEAIFVPFGVAYLFLSTYFNLQQALFPDLELDILSIFLLFGCVGLGIWLSYERMKKEITLIRLRKEHFYYENLVYYKYGRYQTRTITRNTGINSLVFLGGIALAVVTSFLIFGVFANMRELRLLNYARDSWITFTIPEAELELEKYREALTFLTTATYVVVVVGGLALVAMGIFVLKIVRGGRKKQAQTLLMANFTHQINKEDVEDLQKLIIEYGDKYPELKEIQWSIGEFLLLDGYANILDNTHEETVALLSLHDDKKDLSITDLEEEVKKLQERAEEVEAYITIRKAELETKKSALEIIKSKTGEKEMQDKASKPNGE